VKGLGFSIKNSKQTLNPKNSKTNHIFFGWKIIGGIYFLFYFILFLLMKLNSSSSKIAHLFHFDGDHFLIFFFNGPALSQGFFDN
jgi:hypothetical protein